MRGARNCFVGLTTAVVVLALGAGTGTALAAPSCGPAPKTRTLATGLGLLESAIVDRKGRLFVTDGDGLLRLDRPGSRPRRVALYADPGGLVLDGAGKLIAGSGTTIAGGLLGDVTGPAKLLRIDPDSGAQRVYATGLAQANGLARGPDGAIYASNDAGSAIDRVVRGHTQRGWARVQSGNGLVIDTTGRWLYAAQTFVPAAIRQVDLRDPSHQSDYVRPPLSDTIAGLDGMTRDARDRLFVAAQVPGELWRVGRPPRVCALVRGLDRFPNGPSAVVTGVGSGPFPARNVYVLTFGGDVIEVFNVAAPPRSAGTGDPRRPARRPKLRVKVRPRRARIGRRRTFRVRITAFVRGKRRPVRRALVRFAGRRARTNRRGRARIRVRLRKAGRRRVRASKRGYRRGSAVVRAGRRRR